MILNKLEGLADAFNGHDVDAVLTFFADDCVMELPQGPEICGSRFEGKAAVRAGVASRFEGLPDVRYDDATHCVVGQQGISRWTISGTTPEGERIAANGCDFYFFDADARVVRKDSYWKIVRKQP
ncbi:ketosteroid isomerase [Variovorax sp. PAMC 28711]|nr:ketosteroid isomerase [Variovorax sp. PAMC 28711]